MKRAHLSLAVAGFLTAVLTVFPMTRAEASLIGDAVTALMQFGGGAPSKA